VATRSDFTPEQWATLRNAPQLVALATAAAGNSGLFGSVSEGMAMASSMAETLRGDHALLRELFARDDLRAAQDEIKAMIRGVADKSALNATLQEAAASAIRNALAALAGKGGQGDADAYRRLLGSIADKVANASSEGSFLGFGGERVSEGERQFLERLKGLLA